MNKSDIEACQPGTADDNNTTAQNQQVRKANANTNVVGSLVGQREIKFRAWLIPDDDFESELPYMTYDLAFEDYAPVNEQLKSISTLMQYTGLKDRNGKEIYEGDILENDNGVKYIVVWIEQLGGFYLSIPNSQRGKEIISCAASKVANEPMLLFKDMVIGNIFENPELLETLR